MRIHQSTIFMPSMCTENFCTYIHDGELDRAKSVMCNEYFYVNRRNRLGDTPLMHVVIHNCNDMVAQLIEQGADLNIQNCTGDTALMIAARNGFYKIVKLLVEKGADVHIVNHRALNALMMAIEGQGGNSNKQNNSYHDIIEYLLCLEKDLQCCNKNGDTLLTFAVRNGCIEVVKLLLEKGVDVNGCNSNGDTALIIAVSPEKDRATKRAKLVSSNKIEILRILLSNKDLDVNKENPHNGFTALIVAAISDNLAAAKMLFSTGNCDVNKLDKTGKGALRGAAHMRHLEMSRFLIEKGAEVKNCLGIGTYYGDHLPLGASRELKKLLDEAYTAQGGTIEKEGARQEKFDKCDSVLSKFTVTDVWKPGVPRERGFPLFL